MTQSDKFDFDVVSSVPGELSEGPVWDDLTNSLYWVDILRSQLFRLEDGASEPSEIDVGQPIGAVALRTHSGLVGALRDGFAVIDTETRAVRFVAKTNTNPELRMNDGACDARGHFWAGTMTFDSRPAAGELLCLAPDHSVSTVLSGLTTPNGIDWSIDGTQMYLVDSGPAVVYSFALDDDGNLADRRVLIDLGEEIGVPDGLTVDAAGCVWIAVWGAGQVRQYSSDGELQSILRLPVTQVSACAFGGRDLSELFVTSAAVGLGAVDLADQPLAGSVFRLAAGATGRTASRFAG